MKCLRRRKVSQMTSHNWQPSQRIIKLPKAPSSRIWLGIGRAKPEIHLSVIQLDVLSGSWSVRHVFSLSYWVLMAGRYWGGEKGREVSQSVMSQPQPWPDQWMLLNPSSWVWFCVDVDAEVYGLQTNGCPAELSIVWTIPRRLKTYHWTSSPTDIT